MSDISRDDQQQVAEKFVEDIQDITDKLDTLHRKILREGQEIQVRFFSEVFCDTVMKSMSNKETEIVELKNLLQKARLALDKVTQNSNEEYSSKQNTVSLNDPNALLASLRKRRAGRIQEQTLVPPPAQYLYMNFRNVIPL